jgi:hypothetical protein
MQTSRPSLEQPVLWQLPMVAKVLINQVVFLALHYAYDFFPSLLTTLFSGINESVFQHMKISYFAYMLTNVIEMLIVRKKRKVKNALAARLFSTTLFPCIMLLVFLLPPAIAGKVESVLLEIILANIVLLVTCVMVILVERELDRIHLSTTFLIVSLLLFLISGFLYIIFTFQLPWFDVFAIPPGWET